MFPYDAKNSNPTEIVDKSSSSSAGLLKFIYFPFSFPKLFFYRARPQQVMYYKYFCLSLSDSKNVFQNERRRKKCSSQSDAGKTSLVSLKYLFLQYVLGFCKVVFLT